MTEWILITTQKELKRLISMLQDRQLRQIKLRPPWKCHCCLQCPLQTPWLFIFLQIFILTYFKSKKKSWRNHIMNKLQTTMLHPEIRQNKKILLVFRGLIFFFLIAHIDCSKLSGRRQFQKLWTKFTPSRKLLCSGGFKLSKHDIVQDN